MRTGLRGALKRRLAGRPAAEHAVEQYVASPEEWKGNLEIHLRQAGADKDKAVLDGASAVTRLDRPLAIRRKNSPPPGLSATHRIQVRDLRERRAAFVIASRLSGGPGTGARGGLDYGKGRWRSA
jgi:hypothetical protein